MLKKKLLKKLKHYNYLKNPLQEIESSKLENDDDINYKHNLQFNFNNNNHNKLLKTIIYILFSFKKNKKVCLFCYECLVNHNK